jgi:hypothetical protein
MRTPYSHPTSLEFLLREWLLTMSEEGLDAADDMLKKCKCKSTFNIVSRRINASEIHRGP